MLESNLRFSARWDEEDEEGFRLEEEEYEIE